VNGELEFVTTADAKAAVAGREREILDALGVPRPNGKTHICCPYAGHTDKHPSWRWDEKKCMAFCMCSKHDIFAVIQEIAGVDFAGAKVRIAEILRRPDLIRREGCTLLGYAERKRLPVDFLLGLGVRETIGKFGKPQLDIPYRNASGETIAVRHRIALSGKKHTLSEKNARQHLYGLDRLAEARAAGYVVVVDGESDAQTLWHARRPAVGLPGATGWNATRDAAALAELMVFVVVEPDEAGAKLAQRGRALANRPAGAPGATGRRQGSIRAVAALQCRPYRL